METRLLNEPRILKEILYTFPFLLQLDLANPRILLSYSLQINSNIHHVLLVAVDNTHVQILEVYGNTLVQCVVLIPFEASSLDFVPVQVFLCSEPTVLVHVLESLT